MECERMCGFTRRTRVRRLDRAFNGRVPYRLAPGPLLLMERPTFNATAALQFVVNGTAGSSDADATRDAIESGLREAGRPGTVRFATASELARVARESAAKALAYGSAVISVGGDGTTNTVAQAAHAAGCPMGVLPRGTFN